MANIEGCHVTPDPPVAAQDCQRLRDIVDKTRALLDDDVAVPPGPEPAVVVPAGDQPPTAM